MVMNMLSTPLYVFGIMLITSLVALVIGFYSEVALGLEPCMLCIYQRVFFGIAIIWSILGLTTLNKPKLTATSLILTSLTFLINSAVAFYHTGVELKWWRSTIEGCVIPNFGDTPQSILENILSTPSARCDEIPWVDPIFGLSMANHNVALCLVLSVICIASYRLWKKAQTA